MILSVTANLGNYENIKIESSDFQSIDHCKSEIDYALKSFREPRVDDFRKKYLKQGTDVTNAEVI